jgi:hypothetical protein
MSGDSGHMTRRDFISTGGALGAGAVLASSPLRFGWADSAAGRKRLALVGTGIRGVTFWGKFIQQNYGDVAEFAGLCDINPGRLAFGRAHIGVPDCPTFSSFDEMLAVAKPDLVMVATVDSTHDEFIIKALAAGIDHHGRQVPTNRRRGQGILRAPDHGLQLPLRLDLHEGKAITFGRDRRGRDLR